MSDRLVSNKLKCSHDGYIDDEQSLVNLAESGWLLVRTKDAPGE